MFCTKCKTENINEMLVEFLWKDGLDTTTLPKFLHYLRHPKDRQRGFYEPKNESPIEIKKIYCDKCGNFTEIKTTRFGI
jgi:hypothetical protein